MPAETGTPGGDHVEVGAGLTADEGVLIGYRSGRPVPDRLVVGPDARLRTGTILYAGSRIGARLQTGHHTIIREECTIEDDVAVWSNSVIDYGCTIGAGVKIHTNCYVAQFSEIGDNAFLAPGVSFANDLYPGDEDSAANMRGPVIEPGAQLGVNVTVLPYVRVGAGAIVGAGSVVTRDIPAGMVAYGNPAKPVGRVEDLSPIASRVPGRSAT
jgi:acetyltransferase-like isoleucine patch superfamily enzyme